MTRLNTKLKEIILSDVILGNLYCKIVSKITGEKIHEVMFNLRYK